MRRLPAWMLAVCLLVCLALQGHCQDAQPASTAQEVREMAAAGKSFRGTALAGMDLAGLRCANLDLAGTNWARADLRGATFSAVNLRAASMDYVIARGVAFADCDMTDLSMRRADLSGALFRGSQLSGVDLTGATLRGATFDGALYARSGGRHIGALAAAFSALAEAAGTEPGAQPMSTTFAAGLTAQPFAFVYNTADPTRWPMTPFTENPFRAAAAAKGYELEVFYDLAPAKALETLTRAIKAGKVCLLPISMAGEEISGDDVEEGFWAAAIMINDVETPARIVLAVPPFGERRLLPADLAERWAGPWPTLEPVGAERSEARYPLLALSPAEEPRSAQDTVLAALAQAVEVMFDRRTYGTFTPGVAGLQRLSEDLARASQTTDAQLVSTLAPWGGTPKKLLISAREQAAEFLEEAVAVIPQEHQAKCTQAALLFRSEANMLRAHFPSLKPGASDTVQQVQARYNDAYKVINELASIETAAANALQEITGRDE